MEGGGCEWGLSRASWWRTKATLSAGSGQSQLRERKVRSILKKAIMEDLHVSFVVSRNQLTNISAAALCCTPNSKVTQSELGRPEEDSGGSKGDLCSEAVSQNSHRPLRTIQGNRRPHVELQIYGFPAKVQSTWDLCARTKCILIHDTFKITIIDGKKGVDVEQERRSWWWKGSNQTLCGATTVAYSDLTVYYYAMTLHYQGSLQNPERQPCSAAFSPGSLVFSPQWSAVDLSKLEVSLGNLAQGLQWQRAIFYKWFQVPSPTYSSPRSWTKKQLPRCLSLPTSTGQRHSCRPMLRKGPLAKGGIITKRPSNHRAGTSMNKKAQLVVITHTVDPIERVFFLHTLCHKLRLPYCIIKRKAGLGSWSTGRHAPLLPSLRLARKTKVLWLSLWKLSGPIALTDTKRSMSTSCLCRFTIFSFANDTVTLSFSNDTVTLSFSNYNITLSFSNYTVTLSFSNYNISLSFSNDTITLFLKLNTLQTVNKHFASLPHKSLLKNTILCKKQKRATVLEVQKRMGQHSDLLDSNDTEHAVLNQVVLVSLKNANCERGFSPQLFAAASSVLRHGYRDVEFSL
ncbi:hypothetical protein U0070_012769, partial [Myodes glareolus]